MNDGTIDEKNMTYHLAPGEGSSYVFDITTGEIIRQSQPWWFVPVLLLVLVIGLVVLWLRWKRKPEPPTPQFPRDLGPLGSFKSAH